MMYNPVNEIFRVAYGDFCSLKRNILQVIISALVGPLLYLVAFGYGMRVGTSEGGVDYIAYVIPGIIALSSMTAAFASTSQKILIQRLFHSSFDELMLCPMHLSSIVLGKAAIGTVRGLIGCTLTLIIGCILTPDLKITIPLVLFIFLSCVTFSLLGVMAGLLARSSQTLNMINSLIILPMTFLCGTLFSIDALPQPIGSILYFLPLTHSSELIRSAALGWGIEWISILIMFIYFAAFFIIDYEIIKKGKY